MKERKNKNINKEIETTEIISITKVVRAEQDEAMLERLSKRILDSGKTINKNRTKSIYLPF